MKLNLFLMGIALLSISIVSTGCSPTGWTTRDVPTGSDIRQGERVTVFEKDGTRLMGAYEGIVNIPLTDYAVEYDSQILNDYKTRKLPVIGQRIEVTTSLSDSKSWRGQLLGFDYQSLWLKQDGDPEPSKFYISSLTSFSGRDGTILRGMKFRDLFLNGYIPLRSAIALKMGSGTMKIPISSISKISEMDRIHGTDDVASLEDRWFQELLMK